MVDCTSCTKPKEKLGFRGIRFSKFRHIYAKTFRRELCYDNIPITKNAHDSNFCAVNPKFISIVVEVAGGGCFLVLPIEKVGRVEYHNIGKVFGHTGPVLDIKWNPFDDNVIASCSDDATIKLWYIPPGGLETNLSECVVDMRAHRRRVNTITWHKTCENVLASAGFDFKIIIWMTKKAEILSVIDCHSDVIFSMCFNKDGSLLATTCKDKKLRIIEPRSGKVIKEGQCHAGTKASKVIFLGNMGRLLTTGFSRYSDRQFAIWDQSNLSQPLKMEVIDSSSGVLFPFYDNDTSVLYLAGKGDGIIRYYEIVPQAPFVHYLNHFLSGSPQRGFGWLPKRGCDVMRCEIARFYKLHATKGFCEPISMIVPRKSDQFQEDLFSDTAAPVPAITVEEWMSGVNRDPILVSLRTGMVFKTHKPSNQYQSIDIKSAPTTDKNTEKKLAFLLQDTNPDYRTMDEGDYCKDHYNANECEALCDFVPDFDTDTDKSGTRVDDEYDSGISMDLSVGTGPQCSPSLLRSRSASTKILNLIHTLQQEANKYDMAKGKDTNDKWEKTRFNKTAQQNKVANMVLQLQNPSTGVGSTPNLTTNQPAPPQKTDVKVEKDKENQSQELQTSDDYRRAYMRKCFEVERLQLMLAVRDKRIAELEDHITLVTGRRCRTTPTYISNKFQMDITKTL